MGLRDWQLCLWLRLKEVRRRTGRGQQSPRPAAREEARAPKLLGCEKDSAAPNTWWHVLPAGVAPRECLHYSPGISEHSDFHRAFLLQHRQLPSDPFSVGSR